MKYEMVSNNDVRMSLIVQKTPLLLYNCSLSNYS